MKLTDKHNAELLRIYEQQYREGNKEALLQAIQHCGDEKILMPEWVVNAFSEAVNKWFNQGSFVGDMNQIKTLNEAFDIPERKHNPARNKDKHMFRIYHMVESYHDEGIGFPTVYEVVAKRLEESGISGIRKTKVQEYHDKVKELIQQE